MPVPRKNLRQALVKVPYNVHAAWQRKNIVTLRRVTMLSIHLQGMLLRPRLNPLLAGPPEITCTVDSSTHKTRASACQPAMRTTTAQKGRSALDEWRNCSFGTTGPSWTNPYISRTELVFGLRPRFSALCYNVVTESEGTHIRCDLRQCHDLSVENS